MHHLKCALFLAIAIWCLIFSGAKQIHCSDNNIDDPINQRATILTSSSSSATSSLTSTNSIRPGQSHGIDFVAATNTQKFNLNGNNLAQNRSFIHRCTRKSMVLARQTIVKELDNINNYNTIWFSDLDRDEIIQEQKQSLSNIIMSGGANQLLINGRPLLEVEASYLRPMSPSQLPASLLDNHSLFHSAGPLTSSGSQPISIKLIRRFPDRCYLHSEKAQYTYVVGLALGPIEHNLDVIYNLGRDLSVTQPIDWRYAQVKIIVPRMNYEITLKQAADTRLGARLGCPLDVADVTYLSGSNGKPPQLAIVASGLASTNQTVLHLERLFNDYTRPAVSIRLRQVLKFYLNSKTLPLARVTS